VTDPTSFRRKPRGRAKGVVEEVKRGKSDSGAVKAKPKAKNVFLFKRGKVHRTVHRLTPSPIAL
jgi:hypothetical protein